jgi:hypothetical protein
MSDAASGSPPWSTSGARHEASRASAVRPAVVEVSTSRPSQSSTSSFDFPPRRRIRPGATRPCAVRQPQAMPGRQGQGQLDRPRGRLPLLPARARQRRAVHPLQGQERRVPLHVEAQDPTARRVGDHQGNPEPPADLRPASGVGPGFRQQDHLNRRPVGPGRGPVAGAVTPRAELAQQSETAETHEGHPASTVSKPTPSSGREARGIASRTRHEDESSPPLKQGTRPEVDASDRLPTSR